MRWICSTKEATGLNVQEPRGAVETGQGGRHTFTGWLGVGVNTAAPATPSSLCTTARHTVLGASRYRERTAIQL